MKSIEAAGMVDATESRLLFWMSHKGIVRKTALHQAVAAVRNDLDEKGRATYVNTIRRRLLELGHAEALDDAANEWQVLPPHLILIPTQSVDCQALLCGGRTPQFLDQVFTTAENLGLIISVQRHKMPGTPPRIAVTGAQSAIYNMAISLNIPCIDSAARRMIERAKETDWHQIRLQQSSSDATPTKDQYKRWNWSGRQWQRDERNRDNFGDQLGDLVRVEVGYGPRPCLVRYRSQWRRIMSEAQAQFISAKLQDLALAQYNEPHHTLRLCLRPPYFLARPLCLCSGFPSKKRVSESGETNYDFENVPPTIAREWGKAYGVGLTTFDTEVNR